MGFTSVLKAIGQDAARGVAIYAQVQGFEPLLNGLLGAVAPKAGAAVAAVENKADVTITDLRNIAKNIQLVASVQNPPMTNDQKVTAEATLAGQLLQAYGHITDKNVGDPEELSAGVSDLMKAIVRIENALKVAA